MKLDRPEGGGGAFGGIIFGEAPPAGLQPFVLAEIKDLGMKPNTFDASKPDQRKLLFVYQIPIVHEISGRRCEVYFEYTASGGDEANLRKHVVGWAGKDPGEDWFYQEGAMDSLLHNCGYMTIIEKESKNGGTYPKVLSLSPWPADKERISVVDYTPVDERDKAWADKAKAPETEAAPAAAPAAAVAGPGKGLPF